MLFFAILFFYLEFYVAFLVVYILIRLIRRKKLPYLHLIINSLVIAIFFFIRQKFSDHEWSLFGEYLDASEYWENGMGNLWLTVYNLGVVFVAFWITQIIFWIFFKRAIEKKLDLPQVES